MSPLPSCDESKSSSKDEAESLDAESHLRHLELTFELYEENVYDWVLCSIADNALVNKRLARLLDVLHVGCMYHKLNSEAKQMIADDNSLERTIDYDEMETSLD